MVKIYGRVAAHVHSGNCPTRDIMDDLGAISSEGAGPLAFIEGSVTRKKYIKTLNKHFLPLVKTREARGKPTFLQDDNATVHRAKIVTKWKGDWGSTVVTLASSKS